MIPNLLSESTYSEELYKVPKKIQIQITVPWNDLTAAEKSRLEAFANALRDLINPKLRLEAFHVVHVPSLTLPEGDNRPEVVIYFGDAVKGFNQYEVIEAKGTKMVLSGTLGHLISDSNSRGKLWAAMQQLFAR